VEGLGIAKSRGQYQSKSKKKAMCYYSKKYGNYEFKCPKQKNKEECDKPSSSFKAGVFDENLKVQILSLQLLF
jgi:hypothetical protein